MRVVQLIPDFYRYCSLDDHFLTVVVADLVISDAPPTGVCLAMNNTGPQTGQRETLVAIVGRRRSAEPPTVVVGV